MFRRISISVLFIAIFILLSCFPKRIPLEERTPSRVLDKLIGQENKLHSLAVLLSFRAKGKKGSISSNMELYWTKADSFAFYFQSILGVNTARGKLIKDSLEIYFVDENRYYKGDYLNFEDSRSLFKNIKELLNLVVGIYGFDRKRLIESYPQGDKIVYKFEDKQGIWRWWVDSKKVRVEKGICFLKHSKTSYHLNFKSYFESKGFGFPRLIEITSPFGDEFIKLKFIERKVNYPIPARKFDLRIPQGAMETDRF